MIQRITLFTLCLLVALATMGQKTSTALDSLMLTPGVTETLAQSRRAAISDVAYRLSFSIPDALEAPIAGEAEISFRLLKKGDVLLDFQGSLPEAVAEVNGKRCEVVYKEEHIILPAKMLQKGNNRIRLRFLAADKALNRHADYLYTLFVPDKARSVFPCFDQPDLKAKFQVSLDLPKGWTAICGEQEQRLPTYLFSFVAGRFQVAEAERDGRRLRAYYRETDSAKVAQLPIVFDEIALSLRWMEEYTGLPYPFRKYDVVILPGYQFGGMEHPGAVQLTDWEIFLGPAATPDEEYTRMELIAHETAHMWFGDLVTMRWFNDVWTKEVFANFMAAKIARERFPDYDGELNFLKAFQTSALATDRTAGTHPIRQPLANLNGAGLLYGNIIYKKAPVMMRKLEELMGEEPLRKGLQKYLRRYAFANATWDDLVSLLAAEAPEAGVEDFSRAWVDERGLPTITTSLCGDSLLLRESDPDGLHRHWPQRFTVGLVYADTLREVEVNMRSSAESLHLEAKPQAVLPNFSGRGYGRFVYDAESLSYLLTHWASLSSDARRFAALINLNENVRLGNLSSARAYRAIMSGLCDPDLSLWKDGRGAVTSSAINYATSLSLRLPPAERAQAEQELLMLAKTHPLPACRRLLLRFLATNVSSPAVADTLYGVWDAQSEPLLSERDYTDMALRLALLCPTEWKSIVEKQRTRITNADRREEFDFVSRACTPDTAEQHRLALSLLQPEARAVEPWAEKLLRLLSADVREPANNVFLLPLLRAVPDVQRTGDIFFPGKWLSALLSTHRSTEAAAIVRTFASETKAWSPTLRAKFLQSADELLRKEHIYK